MDSRTKASWGQGGINYGITAVPCYGGSGVRYASEFPPNTKLHMKMNRALSGQPLSLRALLMAHGSSLTSLMVQGSGLMAQGSWLKARGSRLTAHDPVKLGEACAKFHLVMSHEP